MLNQQKVKETFLPKLGHFFPERPALLTSKHPSANNHYKLPLKPNAAQLANPHKPNKLWLLPPKPLPNQHSYLFCKSFIEQQSASKKQTTKKERYQPQSARANLAFATNKENEDCIFVKRSKRYDVQRMSVQKRLSEYFQKPNEQTDQFKHISAKLVKIHPEGIVIGEGLSGWSNNDQDFLQDY